MVNLIGGRAASAIMGLCMLALGSSQAVGQGLPLQGSAFQGLQLDVKAAVASLDTDATARPLGRIVAPASLMVEKAIATTSVAIPAPPVPAPAIATLTTTTVVASIAGSISQAQPAQSVTVKLPAAIAREAAWLYQGGWPLAALVDKYSAGAALDEQTNCLATAVYFEARGESLEGQLAVARVVINRASSGKYPPSWCATIKQHAQFSFVQNGQFPQVATGSAAWARAEGVARLAAASVIPSVSTDVLWYHANYVAPSWGRRLSRAQQIGAHIFYRS
ncbi:MAG: cell wall hydrolase [Sphingomicrobium sp.]